MVKERKKGIIIGISVAVIAGTVLISTISSRMLHDMVTVEAGTETLEASQFIINPKKQGTFSTDLSTIDMGVPGEHEIGIKIGNKVYPSKLKVEDTIAPRAEAVEHEIWANEAKEAKDFVKNIVDATEVKISFVEQPDFSKGGSQEVLILLEDLGGNKTELKAVLNIKEDKEPPQIEGVQDQTVYVGDKLSYKRNVVVTDNRDEKVELVIDNSAVNLKEVGSYEVVYSATDSSGNRTEKTSIIKVVEKPKDYVDINDVDVLADKVLSSIIKDNMSTKEKVKAIYTWTKSHIGYIDHSDKSDWVKGAHEGFTKRRGDCFTYYATSRALLTRAGIDNISIIKIDGHHYWSLVNYGDGWYHFDTTPRKGDKEFYSLFMLTDQEIEAYSNAHKNSHVWDKTKYPATP